jgi:hypothetical protein
LREFGAEIRRTNCVLDGRAVGERQSYQQLRILAGERDFYINHDALA